MGCGPSKDAHNDTVVATPTTDASVKNTLNLGPRSIVAGYLQHVSESIGQTIALNERGVAVVTYQHLTFVLEVPDGVSTYFWYTTLTRQPPADSHTYLSVLERSLKVHKDGAGGGVLSLDPTNDHELLFSCSDRVRAPNEKGAKEFRSILENFIAAALAMSSDSLDYQRGSIVDRNTTPPDKVVTTPIHKVHCDNPALNNLSKNRKHINRLLKNGGLDWAQEFKGEFEDKPLRLRLDDGGELLRMDDGLYCIMSVSAIQPALLTLETPLSLMGRCGKAQLLKSCLTLNYLQQETCGGTLSLFPNGDMLMYTYQDWAAEMTTQDLHNVLSNYRETVLKLKKRLLRECKLQESYAWQQDTVPATPTYVGTDVFEDDSSEFVQWKQSIPNGKSTLEQQLEYAQKLSTEALGPEAAPLGVDHFVNTLRETPIDKTNTSLVTWQGLHVGWLLEVFFKSPYMERLRNAGAQLWFVRKCCIVELVRRSKLQLGGDPNTPMAGPLVHHIHDVVKAWGMPATTNDNKPIVSNATTFVSYTGRYTLPYLVQVLAQLDPNEYIWFDVLTVDQFAWTGKGRSPEMQHFRDSFLGDLQGQIQAINRTALVLEKWDNVMATLEQIWVLWEIFNTAEAGSKMTVLLPPDQIDDFVRNTLYDTDKFSKVEQSLAAIDATKGRAEDDSDRNTIYVRMKAAGLSKVNAIVSDKMRNWLADVALERLAEQRQWLVDNKQEHGGLSVKIEFLHNLARLLENQSRYDEAEPLFREVVEAVGKEENNESAYLVAKQSLAKCLYQRDEYEEAEQLLREVVECNPDFIDNALTLLGTTLTHQHKFEEAEAVLGRAVAISREKRGLNHAATLHSLDHYARLLTAIGKLDEAEKTHRDTLKGRRELLGDRTSDTLASLCALAQTLQAEGKMEEAESLWREAYGLTKEVMGTSNNVTLTIVQQLGILLHTTGRTGEAESFFRELAVIRKQTLGPDHPQTLADLSNVAGILSMQHKFTESEPILRYILECRKNLLGDDHEETIDTTVEIATVLMGQGRLKEAEPLFRDALSRRRRVLGPGHEDTLTTMNNLGAVLHEQGKHSESLALIQETVAISEQKLGKNHPETLSRRTNLAILKLNTGDTRGAHTMLEQILAVQEKELGSDHPDTVQTRRTLALLNERMK